MMTKRMFLRTLAITSAAVLTGCVNTVDGRKHYGNPLTKNKVELIYSAPVTLDELFQACKRVLGEMGNLFGENTITHTLEAKVNDRSVYIKVEEIASIDNAIGATQQQAAAAAQTNVKAIIQVRARSGGPDMALASDIKARIVQVVEQTRLGIE